MGGVIGIWVAGTVLACALAAVNAPFTLMAVTAVGSLLLSVAWGGVVEWRDRRREREPVVLAAPPPWTDEELAALDDAAGALVRLLEGLPEARRERTFP